MGGRRLRFLRYGVSLLFFSMTALLFLDLAGSVQPGASTGVLYPQFTPSVIRLLQGSLWAASSLVFLLLATLLWGRVFCSSVCPLALLQDVVSRLAIVLKHRRQHRHFRYSKPHTAVRYGVLLVFLIGLMSGSVLLIGLLDPYSHFGRIMGLLARPVVVLLNNLAARVAAHWDSYAFTLVDVSPVRWHAILFPLAIFVLIGAMALLKGRLFCNTLCPVGTFLGLLSRVSLFRIRIDGSKCDLCGKCAVECKAGCIDLKSRTVDFSRCVACYNCIAACRESAIAYRRSGRSSSARRAPENALESPMVFPRALQNELRATVVDASRRSFLALNVGWFVGLSTSGAPSDVEACTGGPVVSKVPVDRKVPVVAPGAKGIDHLRSSCIACQLCVASCPTRVLQPSLLQLGARSLLQPHLDFRVAFCAYECTRCGDVCPTQAIERLTGKVKKRVKIGEVRLVEENCLAIAEKSTCGACAEYCPTRAVYMVLGENGGIRPKLDVPVCIGCGACEHVCPAQPHKAIYVEGAQEHRRARPPRNFPFHHYKQSQGFPF